MFDKIIGNEEIQELLKQTIKRKEHHTVTYL